MSAEAELAGRVALIVGATGAVGRAAAARLAGAGAALMLADDKGAAGLEALARGLGAQFHGFDPLAESDWAVLTEAVLRGFGRLDILVNALGGEVVKPIDALDLAEFRALHRRVLHPAFLGVRFGAEAIRRGGEGGSIINVSSIVAKISGPGLSALSSIHGGLRMLTKAAALELGPEHIRVNALQLGPQSEAVADALGRSPGLATAAAAADSILFLASDRARFMTGAELVADGGILAGG